LDPAGSKAAEHARLVGVTSSTVGEVGCETLSIEASLPVLGLRNLESMHRKLGSFNTPNDGSHPVRYILQLPGREISDQFENHDGSIKSAESSLPRGLCGEEDVTLLFE
jgi:hypothetical protein